MLLVTDARAAAAAVADLHVKTFLSLLKSYTVCSLQVTLQQTMITICIFNSLTWRKQKTIFRVTNSIFSILLCLTESCMITLSLKILHIIMFLYYFQIYSFDPHDICKFINKHCSTLLVYLLMYAQFVKPL